MSFPLAVWRKKMELCKKIHNIAWRIEPWRFAVLGGLEYLLLAFFSRIFTVGNFYCTLFCGIFLPPAFFAEDSRSHIF